MRGILLTGKFIKNLFSKDKKLKIEGDIKGINFIFEDVEKEEEVEVEVEIDEEAQNNRVAETPAIQQNRTTRNNDIDYTLVVPPVAQTTENNRTNSISSDSSTDELIEFLLQRLSEERQTNNSNPKVKTKTK